MADRLGFLKECCFGVDVFSGRGTEIGEWGSDSGNGKDVAVLDSLGSSSSELSESKLLVVLKEYANDDTYYRYNINEMTNLLFSAALWRKLRASRCIYFFFLRHHRFSYPNIFLKNPWCSSIFSSTHPLKRNKSLRRNFKINYTKTHALKLGVYLQSFCRGREIPSRLYNMNFTLAGVRLPI